MFQLKKFLRLRWFFCKVSIKKWLAKCKRLRNFVQTKSLVEIFKWLTFEFTLQRSLLRITVYIKGDSSLLSFKVFRKESIFFHITGFVCQKSEVMKCTSAFASRRTRFRKIFFSWVLFRVIRVYYYFETHLQNIFQKKCLKSRCWNRKKKQERSFSVCAFLFLMINKIVSEVTWVKHFAKPDKFMNMQGPKW